MSIRQIYQLSLTALTVCILSASSVAQGDVVKWRLSVDAAKLEATETNKLILLHFWTPSCGPCKRLDSDVFSQPQIGQLLDQYFVPVKINADQSPALASSYNIDRVPTDVVVTAQGNVVAKLSCPPTPAGYGTQLLNLAQHYKQQAIARNTPAQAPVQSAYAGLKVGQYNNAQMATAPTTAQQNPGVPAAGPPVTAPQVTNNPYVAATASPQLSAPPVNAASGRYAQASNTPPQPPTAQPPAVQPASAQAAVQPSNQLAAAQSATAPQTPPQAPQSPSRIVLPEGAPPLAFEGYCPVSLKHVRKWVLGSTKFGAIHRGRTYLFTGEAQRKQFLANPDAYSPVFSGIDPVKLLEEQKTVEGNRRFGYEYRGAFYLFSSQESMARFASQPDQYAAGVRQAMTRLDGTVGGTIRR